jgi:carbamate kinase
LASAASSKITRNNKDRKQHIVVALGGNALLKRGEKLNVQNQRKNIADGISSLSSVLKNNKITFVHGNGPQVGLLALQGAAYQHQSGTEAMELDVLDAETEGMIGYLLEQEINHALGDEAKKRGVVTLLSQIIVDPKDKAFDNPTKFIGPVYSKEDALKLGKPVKPDGKFYRQVVPSPMPVRLIDEQLTAVKLLTDHNVILICAGGGGIPVVLENNRLKGIEAVIDKDRAACMMGKTLGADGLMILTDVTSVAVNLGKPDEKWIKSASPQQMLALADSNFPDGSMGPKVSSAVDFVQNGGWSMIGSLKDASKMLEKEAGTTVTNEFGEDHLEFY